MTEVQTLLRQIRDLFLETVQDARLRHRFATGLRRLGADVDAGEPTNDGAPAAPEELVL
jgi:hypothetical protein